MALHKTQCPHCFTTYVISDEQYRVSEGMVRCGTCRERFQARLITSQEIPRFDPRKAFIEPLSEEPVEQAPPSTDLEPSSIEFADPHTETNEDPEQGDDAAFNELGSVQPQTDVEPESTVDVDIDAESISALSIETLDAERALSSIIADHSENLDEQRSVSTTAESDSAPEEVTGTEHTKSQGELELPEPVHPEKPTRLQDDSNSPANDATQSGAKLAERSQTTPVDSINDDSALIDQVDHLINDKLVPPEDSSISTRRASKPVAVPPTRRTQRPNHRLDPRLAQRLKPRPAAAPAPRSGSKLSRWFWLSLMAIITSLLLVTLVYQLWLKQILVFPPGSYGERLMQKVTPPIAAQLAQRDIVLPVRRNLSQLELLSARTEAHPTRSSTTLLRISLINHAKIAQPLPWLELTLTDSEGKLVSRRQLSPLDYLYNNNTEPQIGSRELKKITVELLAFPKQASGYELRLLNK